MSDYINRKDTIKTIESETYRHDYLDHVIDIIEDIPSADVAPVRHGRWECGEENAWWCSVCDEELYLEDGTPQENEYRYCPNCGARMDAKE